MGQEVGVGWAGLGLGGGSDLYLQSQPLPTKEKDLPTATQWGKPPRPWYLAFRLRGAGTGEAAHTTFPLKINT